MGQQQPRERLPDALISNNCINNSYKNMKDRYAKFVESFLNDSKVINVYERFRTQ